MEKYYEHYYYIDKINNIMNTTISWKEKKVITPTFSLTIDNNKHTANSKRGSDSCGKIVKNFSRMKTQASSHTESKAEEISAMGRTNKILTEASENQSFSFKKQRNARRYSFKSEDVLNSYQEKLAAYERMKKEIIIDLGRVSSLKKQIPTHLKDKQQKTQHFFTSTLKQTLLKQHLNKQNAINTEQNKKDHISKANSKLQEEKQRFVQEIDQQIRLQGNLRKLKMQINSRNRRAIKNIISNTYSIYQYDQEKLIKVDYQEFEPSFVNTQSKLNAISPEVIAEKLIQAYQLCQNNWKEKIRKNFSALFIKKLYHTINEQGRLELDLKMFTREFNLYFRRHYQPTDLFKVYQYTSPLTKGNFLYNFSR